MFFFFKKKIKYIIFFGLKVKLSKINKLNLHNKRNNLKTLKSKVILINLLFINYFQII